MCHPLGCLFHGLFNWVIFHPLCIQYSITRVYFVAAPGWVAAFLMDSCRFFGYQPHRSVENSQRGLSSTYLPVCHPPIYPGGPWEFWSLKSLRSKSQFLLWPLPTVWSSVPRMFFFDENIMGIYLEDHPMTCKWLSPLSNVSPVVNSLKSS